MTTDECEMSAKEYAKRRGLIDSQGSGYTLRWTSGTCSYCKKTPTVIYAGTDIRNTGLNRGEYWCKCCLIDVYFTVVIDEL